MRLKNAFRPRVESLEDRWVPATIKLAGSTLMISNQSGPLTVQATGTNVVKITDGATNLTVGTGGLIYITGTNKADTITFDTNGNKFGGSLLINSGNGGDTVTVTGGGSIGGNVQLITGLGNDTITMDNPTVIGGSLLFSDTYGNNKIDITAAAKIGGNATLTGTGILNITGAATIGGALSVTASLTTGTPLVATLTGVTVGKTSTFTGGSGDDSVTITGGTFGGNVQVNLSSSLTATGNKLTVNGGALLNGSLSYVGTAGVDTVEISGASSVAGNVSINSGDGANVFTLTDATSLVLGNMSIWHGNDNLAAATKIGTTVSGALNITLGNGNNAAVTVATPPGGKFTWRSGNGTNTLNVGDGATAGSWVVDVLFGSADDTFVLNLGTATDAVSGSINGGGRTAANTFTQTQGTLSPNLVISNFP